MNYLIKAVLLQVLIFLLFACHAPSGEIAWKAFKACDGRKCVSEALAVKNALLINPKSTLILFNDTYEQGEDHVIGWLYLLRDSVLLNPVYGSLQKRIALQDKIIKTIRPYEDDPLLGEMAKSILGEMESFSIQAGNNDLPLEILTPATGLYVLSLPKNAGTVTLQISQTSIDALRFSFRILHSGSFSNPINFKGKAQLNQNKAQAWYTSTTIDNSCKLNFDFTENSASVKIITGSTETCGFGSGLAIEGSYRRKSFEDPILSKLDAKKMASLLGEWQSTDDPRAKIKIADGRYQDWYDGLPVETFLCVYFSKCPRDCNPKTPTPCLKIFGQDEVCYIILKVDDYNLVLSPIGGSGKSNSYTRLTE